MDTGNVTTPTDSRQAWGAVLGGLHSAVDAAALIGEDVEVLSQAADAGRVIVLRDSGGRDLYPGFQFRGGWPPAALIAAYRTIAEVADPWTAASWSASPDPLLGGQSPAESVIDGNGDLVLQLASRDAARLAA